MTSEEQYSIDSQSSPAVATPPIAPLLRGGRGKRRFAISIAAFVLLSAAVPYAIYQKAEPEALRLDDRWLSLPLLSSCLLLLVLYFSFDGLRLFYTLKSLGHRVSLKKLAPLVFINILVSNVTPMSTGGGFAQILYLRGLGVKVGTATAATTLRTLLAVVFIFLPTPFLLFYLPRLHASPLGDQLTVYLAIFALVYLGFFAVLVFRMKWILALASAVLWLLARFHIVGRRRVDRWRFGLLRETIRFSHALGAFFKAPPADVALALLFTALFLLSLFSFPALLLWGLGYQLSYPMSLGLMVVTTFIMYFSPTPGAAGIAEAVFGLFFASLVKSGDLILAIVAWRFLTVYLGMVIGLPFTAHAIFGRGRKNG